MLEPKVHFTLPHNLMAWFMVCTTSELKRGRILSRQVNNQQFKKYFIELKIRIYPLF